MKEKLVTIYGTRPEIIRLSCILPKLDEHFNHIMINTHQNFKQNLNDNFIRELGIRRPHHYLTIDHDNYGCEVGDIIDLTYQLLSKIKPNKLLILGDTYSGLCVLPASNLGIKIYHMEAGMRSDDWKMPEEKNRRIIDHLADINLPYTENSRHNLLRENINPRKIFVTGNPIFEVLEKFQEQIDMSQIISKLELKKKKYYLVTIHRHENVTNPTTIKNIIYVLDKLSKRYKVVVLIHPRFREVIGDPDIIMEANPNMMLIDNVGFFDFIHLQKHAKCVLTDSGTVPEECAYNKIPCVSVRDSFERPELVDNGMTIVSGTKTESILRAVEISEGMEWGDHKFETNVSEKVLRILGGKFD